MKNNQENTSNVASPQANDTHVTPTPTDQPITASVPETNQQVMQTTSTGPEIQPANQVQGAPVTTPTPQPTTANSGGNFINKLKSFGVGPIVTVIAIAVVLVVAVVISALLVFVILCIPGLREIFSIPVLPTENIVELVCLVLAPIVIVEIFKLFKINGGEE